MTREPEFYEDMPENELEEIKDRLIDIESKLDSIERSMLTESKVFWWIIFVGVFAFWGDKIWGFLKGTFLFILALISYLVGLIKG
jgi:hypothetical protein